MAFTERKQCIHCSVETCQHHDYNNACKLDTIQVSPRKDCHTCNCDESLCSSYESRE